MSLLATASVTSRGFVDRSTNSRQIHEDEATGPAYVQPRVFSVVMGKRKNFRSRWQCFFIFSSSYQSDNTPRIFLIQRLPATAFSRTMLLHASLPSPPPSFEIGGLARRRRSRIYKAHAIVSFFRVASKICQRNDGLHFAMSNNCVCVCVCASNRLISREKEKIQSGRSDINAQ